MAASSYFKLSTFIALGIGVLLGSGAIWGISVLSPLTPRTANASKRPLPTSTQTSVALLANVTGPSEASGSAAFEAAARANVLAAARITNRDLTGSSAATATWSPPYSNVVCGSSPIGQWIIQTNDYGAIRYKSNQIGFWKIWQIDLCSEYAPTKQAKLEAEELYQRTHPLDPDCALRRLTDHAAAIGNRAATDSFNRKHPDPHECNK